MSDQQLAEKLHKPDIKKSEKSSFKDDISGIDLADIKLVNILNLYLMFYWHL